MFPEQDDLQPCRLVCPLCKLSCPSSYRLSLYLQTPPPDDPAHLSSEPVSRPRIWFSHSIASYQSGGLPSSTVVSQTAATSTDIERGQHNEWETTYGLRVDLLAAFAYLLGPISGSTVSLFSARACISTPTALALLILEVHNDYVRFHGQLVLSLFDLLGR